MEKGFPLISLQKWRREWKGLAHSSTVWNRDMTDCHWQRREFHFFPPLSLSLASLRETTILPSFSVSYNFPGFPPFLTHHGHHYYYHDQDYSLIWASCQVCNIPQREREKKERGRENWGRGNERWKKLEKRGCIKPFVDVVIEVWLYLRVCHSHSFPSIDWENQVRSLSSLSLSSLPFSILSQWNHSSLFAVHPGITSSWILPPSLV